MVWVRLLGQQEREEDDLGKGVGVVPVGRLRPSCMLAHMALVPRSSTRETEGLTQRLWASADHQHTRRLSG